MQMSNQKKTIKSIMKKSHILIFGSFLILVGVFLISYNHILRIKNEIFSDMKIAISDSLASDVHVEQVVDSIPIADNVVEANDEVVQEKPVVPNFDYSKYLGVLEIPRIGLKRGFFGTDSKYNDIEHNVTLVRGSTMPDIVSGNLILMAHSGDAYISYFAYLYRLTIGNDIYVTYKNNKYHYKLVNIYDVDKTGSVKIIRNYDRTTLTLITCTKNDDSKQTVYIAELV